MEYLTLGHAVKASIVASLLSLIFLAGLYFWGARKNQHGSLWMLLSGSVLYVPYLVMTTISLFVELPQQLATDLYRVGMLLFFPALLLSVLGSVLLVKAYVAAVPQAPPPQEQKSGRWGP